MVSSFNQIKLVFLALVLTQGIHAVEEYSGRLWEVFSPARFLTGLVSENHEIGFIVITSGLFVFGMTYWLFAFRNHEITAMPLLWFWILLEGANGVGHVAWSVFERSYTPGVLTAPILFILSVVLARKVLSNSV